MKKASLKSEALRIIQRFVYELALLFVYYVMVTDKLLSTLSFAHFVWFVGDTTGYESVTDSNESFLYEVHLIHFLIFVVNNTVVLVVLKASRKEALRNLEKKLDILLFILWALGVIKKAPESCDHVMEEVVDCDFNFYFIRYITEI